MESIVDSKQKLHFFQYLEVDLMQDYFRNGIHYFVNAFLNSHQALVPLRYWAQQITALIDFLKDFFCIQSYGGTYAQNFFGLGRGEMKKWSALRGAFVWTILPYLGSKVDNFYNQIVGEQLDGARLSLFKKLIKQIYPYLYMIFGLLQTFYKFRYLYLQDGKDYYYHLFYRIEKLHLKRLPSDGEQQYPILQLLKKPGLLLVLVGHKVLTWYFSQKKEGKRKRQAALGPIPAPVVQEKVDDGNKCSICTERLKNPAVVRTTGYVYCWQCIEGYIRKEGRCPLGGLEVAPEQLQILHDLKEEK